MSAIVKRPREAPKGRLEPTEPFHMSTRRGRKPHQSVTSSFDGSLADDASRRGSLDSIRPTSSDSSPGERPAKKRRVSTTPPHAATAATNGFNLAVSESGFGSMSVNSLDSLDASYDVIRVQARNLHEPSNSSPLSPRPDQQSRTHDALSYYVTENSPEDEDYTADTIPDNDLPSQQESGASSESDDHLALDVGYAVAPSTDATPAASGPASPASTAGSLDNVLPKATDIVNRAFQDDPDDDQPVEPAEPDDVDDADADEIEEVVKTDDEGRPRRRLPGKRRAHHPIPVVEAAMRRQLELKTSFRTISRALKPMLAEIAQRTVTDLEDNERLHEKAREHEVIKRDLQKILDGRLAQLRKQRELNVQQLQRTLEAESRARKTRCQCRLEDLQDEVLDALEHRMLQVVRAAALDGEAQCETEDEDDVVPRPKGQDYKLRRKGALDPAYESRSRLRLETWRIAEDLQRRLAVRDLLRDADLETPPDKHTGFTVMDTLHRDIAEAKRQGATNVATLVEAATEAARLDAEQDRRRALMIPNERAYGLQLLSDTATRPSLAAPWPFVLNQHPQHPRLGQAYAPDHERLQPYIMHPMMQQPLSGGLRPLTSREYETHCDRTMPPPSTPRQAGQELFATPEMHRRERAVPPSPLDLAQRDTQQLPPLQSPRTHQSSGRNSTSHHESSYSSSRPDGSAAESRTHLQHGDGGGNDPLLRSPEVMSPSTDSYTPRLLDDIGRRRADSELSRFSVPSGRASEKGTRPSSPFQWNTSTARDQPQLDDTPTRARRGEHHDRPVRAMDQAMKEEGQHARPWQERSCSPGAGDAHRRESSASHRPSRPSIDIPKQESPSSRRSSVSFGTRDSASKSGNLPFPLKTNREERGGQSRKQWKQKHRHHKSLGEPRSAGAQPAKPHALAGSPPSLPARPSWQQPAPSQSSQFPPSPTTYQQPPQALQYGQGSAPQPGWSYPPHYQPDYYNPLTHRNSFPPLPPPPQQPAWQHQPPPSPLYAMPQGSHSTRLPPPPPGMSFDQFQAQYSSVPPQTPGYSPPVPMHPPPSSTYSGQQYGGPPIAPAAPDPRLGHPGGQGYGPGPPSLPAFAQQQRHDRSQSDNFRRRVQSDAGQQNTFRQWFPGQQRR